jgi:phenylacetate-coenzyme A ligase PaaK-like adenylate-forming protein
MIFDKDVEIRSPEEQRRTDEALYRKQIEYLFARSPFYRRKLASAGFRDAKSVGELESIHHLPCTVKDELRKSQAEQPPFGDFLAADPGELMRIYSTSGTTGGHRQHGAVGQGNSGARRHGHFVHPVLRYLSHRLVPRARHRPSKPRP